jgi:uncharacterized protein YbdZ (MbtH family)
MGAMVNNSNAQGNFQTLLELREENHPREQGRHSCWNPDRGSRNQVPGGWEFVGDDGADGDVDYGNIGRMVNL